MATYILLNILTISLVVLVLYWRKLFTITKLTGVIMAVLLVLTAIFDSLIVYFDIVAYNADKISGVYIGLAPIEDFFYAILACILIPAVWHGLRKKHE